MRQWEATHPGAKPKDSFPATLRLQFKSSTWNDNSRAWFAAGDVEGEQERWIALGRTGDGEWRKFMQVWRQTK
ncbi:hypothetical protein GSI_10094 [Ganoderma sinense ZZ0214-1]|uniref:Uncharacterized protein n=1 Tax=Ganoderma sinense ZZ0214-1 TaxID=1077348 RepID=A0A2G8RZL4_9APHY|nr:hypothetical protein GSI_10094 [Ganoderma sinense ZZ0214-1]